MIDRELWQRTRSLFDELVEMDSDARHSRLDAIGAEDPALRDAVERLLLADGGSEAELSDYQFGSPGSAPPATRSRDPLGVIGQTVSHFHVLDYLAAGGMGVVYTAEDLKLRRTVALKFPLPNQHLDRTVEERFINEGRSAAALDHPNLCTIYEVGASEYGVFLAMPLYPGETLKDRIARQGSLPAAEALDIITQVATGLACAHAAGIVHRDLKPANVMLLPGGAVKILDFGLAKIRDISLTKSHATLGTIGYIAPEQIRSAPVDARTDLWAIGVMIYEMLTGRLPFRGEHEISILHAILHEEPPQPSTLNESLSSPFDDLVGALLQKNPGDRYQSAEALLADTAALQRGEALAHRTRFWSRTARRRRARRVMLPISAFAALAVIGGVSWYVYRGNVTPESRTAAQEKVPALRFVGNTAVISSSAELSAALVPANSGRHIRIRSGTYDLVQPLSVPDGITLEGEGVMQFDPEGHPTGFSDRRHTVLRMTTNVGGDVLTLGNDVTLRNLEIVDLAGRSGNVVAVASRRPGDNVSATIVESVIVNPNPLTIGAGGALGRGIHIATRNRNMGADPPPDNGSVLSVRVLRSVIRSPAGGGGMFAFNFSANSRISIEITRNVIGGSNEADGGVSRPDAVHNSEVNITSQGNIYRNEWQDQCASALLGWNLTGGSGAPIPTPTTPATTKNRLRLRSVDDRIDGFTTGVLATGSRRFFSSPLNAAPSGNHIDLQLIGTRISTPSCASIRRGENSPELGGAGAELIAIRDLDLVGGWVKNDALAAGDGNTVRAEIRGVTGSGMRANKYANVGTSFERVPAQLQGIGNKLEIVGTSQDFARANHGIVPAPPAGFFISGR